MRIVLLCSLLLAALGLVVWGSSDTGEDPQASETGSFGRTGGFDPTGGAVRLQGRSRASAADGRKHAAALLEALAARGPGQRLEVFRRHPETIAYLAALAEVLVGCLRSPDENVRFAASLRLEQMGSQALPPLRPFLRSDDAELRTRVRNIFDHWMATEGVVLELDYAALLGSDHVDIVGLALGAVAARKTYDPSVAEQLLTLAATRSTKWEGMFAREVLADMGPEGLALLRPLLAADFRGASTKGRLAALRLMSNHDGDWSAFVPALVEVLEDDDEERTLAFLALDCLARKSAWPEGAVPVLLQLVAHPDERLASRAAEVLGLIGVQPDIVLPALATAIREDGSEAAARAMAAYGESGFASALTILRDGDPAAREAALFVFAQQGEAAAAIVPEVLRLIGGEDVFLSERAIYTAGEIGPRADGAVPLIMAILAQEADHRELKIASHALARLGPAADTSVRAALGSSKDVLRRQALRVVATGFRGRAPFGSAELEASFSSKNEAEMYLAAEALIMTFMYPEGYLKAPPGVDDRAARARLRRVLERLSKLKKEPAYYRRLLDLLVGSG